MSEPDPLAPLTAELDKLAIRVEAGGRKRLTAAIATDLRSAAAKRLRANVTPDGEPMAPRKPRARPVRLRPGAPDGDSKAKMGRMFQRAASPGHLRKASTEDQAQVGFAGADARIMRVHQLGLRDRVSREPGAPEVTYPARTVIGFSEADRARVMDKAFAVLAT